MRRLIIAALLAAGPAMAGDEMVLRGAGGEYRLTQAVCTLPIALASAKPEYAQAQRAGRLITDGRTLAFCWIAVGDAVYAMDENGQIHVGPISGFKRSPGV